MKSSHKVRPLIIVSLFTAIIAILAQIVIPLPLIPITGQTFAIGLVAIILGRKYGTLAVVLYICIGSAGAPVFANMTGGIGILLGPTGGYIFSFIPAAYLIGLYMDKMPLTIPQAFIANLIGMAVNLTIGTVWLKYYGSYSWAAAFLSGVAPFIIVGMIKAFLSAYIGVQVKRRLLSSRLLRIA
ncbi:MAG: biotin transporter BioY [Bacillus sp. (in: firmicutes)]